MTKQDIVDELWIKHDYGELGYSPGMFLSMSKKYLLKLLKQERVGKMSDMKCSCTNCSGIDWGTLYPEV